jgi:tetratricopeptide (TPR) repeat protein
MKTLVLSLLLVTLALSQSKTVTKTVKADEVPSKYLKLAKKTSNTAKKLKNFNKALSLIDQFGKEADQSKIPNKYRKASDRTYYSVQINIMAANYAIKGGLFKPAKKYLETALSLDKSNSTLWYVYGNFYYKQSKPVKAENAFINYIKIAEKDLAKLRNKKRRKVEAKIAEAYYRIGKVLPESKRTKKISYFKKAIKVYPNHVKAMLFLGDSYQNEKNFKGMFKAYSDLVNVASKSKKLKKKYLFTALFKLGVAEFKLKKYKSVIKTYGKLGKLKAKKNKQKRMLDDAYYYTGESYLKLGNESKAAKNFKRLSDQKNKDNAANSLQNYITNKKSNWNTGKVRSYVKSKIGYIYEG